MECLAHHHRINETLPDCTIWQPLDNITYGSSACKFFKRPTARHRLAMVCNALVSPCSLAVWRELAPVMGFAVWFDRQKSALAQPLPISLCHLLIAWLWYIAPQITFLDTNISPLK